MYASTVQTNATIECRRLYDSDTTTQSPDRTMMMVMMTIEKHMQSTVTGVYKVLRLPPTCKKLLFFFSRWRSRRTKFGHYLMFVDHLNEEASSRGR